MVTGQAEVGGALGKAEGAETGAVAGLVVMSIELYCARHGLQELKKRYSIVV